jgi:hypothetical protein
MCSNDAVYLQKLLQGITAGLPKLLRRVSLPTACLNYIKTNYFNEANIQWATEVGDKEFSGRRGMVSRHVSKRWCF